MAHISRCVCMCLCLCVVAVFARKIASHIVKSIKGSHDFQLLHKLHKGKLAIENFENTLTSSGNFSKVRKSRENNEFECMAGGDRGVINTSWYFLLQIQLILWN